MDAAQESKGSTENSEDSDDPDSAYCQNEKRKGRFLIEEIEEENPVLDNNMYYISDEKFKVGRCQSFNMKRYNFSVNTLGYNEVTNDGKENLIENGLIKGYILDYTSNKFIKSENILKKNKSLLNHKYIDLYPHTLRGDCIECKNECKYRVTLDDMGTVESRPFDKNDAYSETARNVREFSEREEEVMEKLIKQEQPPNMTCKFKSQNFIKNECDLISETKIKQEISPHSFKVQKGKFNLNALKNSFQQNFKEIKEEKFLYYSPRIKTNMKNIENEKKDPPKLLSKSLLKSAGTIKEKKSTKNFNKKSVENYLKSKLFLRKFSERRYSADHPLDFKDEKDDRVVKRNFNMKKRKEIENKFSLLNENFEICQNKNVKIENSISFSIVNAVGVSEKICQECIKKLFHTFCGEEND